MDAPDITLGSASATLVRPRAIASIALTRTQADMDKGGSGLLCALGAAALFLTWPADRTWPAKPRPRLWQPGQPLAPWGGDLFDGLVDAGVGMDDLIPICGQAYTWALSSRLSQEDVDTAGNSSGAPKAP